MPCSGLEEARVCSAASKFRSPLNSTSGQKLLDILHGSCLKLKTMVLGLDRVACPATAAAVIQESPGCKHLLDAVQGMLGRLLQEG